MLACEKENDFRFMKQSVNFNCGSRALIMALILP